MLRWGGRLARDGHEGRRGSCCSVADLPLCPSPQHPTMPAETHEGPMMVPSGGLSKFAL